MKKIVSMLLACILLVGTMLSLASCGNNLSGKYEGEINIMVASYNVSYEFKGSNVKVTRTVSSMFSDDESFVINGKYEIAENEDGKLEITFEYETEDDVINGGTFPFEKGDGYIKISGIKYEKAD